MIVETLGVLGGQEASGDHSEPVPVTMGLSEMKWHRMGDPAG